MLAFARKYNGLAAYRRTYTSGSDTYYANDLTQPYLTEIRYDKCRLFWDLHNTAPVAGGGLKDQFGTWNGLWNGPLGPSTINGPVVANGWDDDSIYKQSNTTALEFDGDSYVKGPEYAGDNAPGDVTGYPFTIECWGYFGADPDSVGQQFIAGLSSTDDGNDYAHYIATTTFTTTGDNQTKIRHCGIDNGTTEVELDDNFTVPWCKHDMHGSWEGRWNHCVSVVTASRIKLYVNGRLVNTTTHSVTFSPNDYRFGVGGLLDTSGGSDTVSEKADLCNLWGAALYGTELTGYQVARHYIAARRCYDLKLESGDDDNDVAIELTRQTVRTVGEPYASAVVFPDQEVGNKNDTTRWWGLIPNVMETNGIHDELSGRDGGTGFIANVRLHQLPCTIFDCFNGGRTYDTYDGYFALTHTKDGGWHMWLDNDGGTQTLPDSSIGDTLLPVTRGGMNTFHGQNEGIGSNDYEAQASPGNTAVRTWPTGISRKNRYNTIASIISGSSSQHDFDGNSHHTMLVDNHEIHSVASASVHEVAFGTLGAYGFFYGSTPYPAFGGDTTNSADAPYMGFDIGVDADTHGESTSSAPHVDHPHFEGIIGPYVIIAGRVTAGHVRRINRAIKGHPGLRTRPTTTQCNRHPQIICEGRRGLTCR